MDKWSWYVQLTWVNWLVSTVYTYAFPQANGARTPSHVAAVQQPVAEPLSTSAVVNADTSDATDAPTSMAVVPVTKFPTIKSTSTASVKSKATNDSESTNAEALEHDHSLFGDINLYYELKTKLAELIASARYKQLVNVDIANLNSILDQLNSFYVKSEIEVADQSELRATGSVVNVSKLYVKTMKGIIELCVEVANTQEFSLYDPRTWYSFGINYPGRTLKKASNIIDTVRLLLESYDKSQISEALENNKNVAESIARHLSEQLSPRIAAPLEYIIKSLPGLSTGQPGERDSIIATVLSLKTDAESLKKFAELPDLVRNSALTLMEEVNIAIGNLCVALDNTETNYGLEHGTLFKALTFNLVFPSESPLAKSILQNMSIKDFCEKWSNSYTSRMTSLGYINALEKADTFPFELTIYHGRTSHLKILTDKLEDRIKSLREKANNHYTKDIRNLHVTYCNLLAKEKDETKKQQLQYAVDFIEEYANKFPNIYDGQDYSTTFKQKQMQLEAHLKENPNDQFAILGTKIAKELKAIYFSIEKTLDEDIKKEKETIARLKNEINATDPIIIHRPLPKRENHYQFIRDTLKDARDKANDIINRFYPSNPTEQSGHTEESINAKMLSEKFRPIQIYLENILDPLLVEEVRNRKFINLEHLLPTQKLLLIANEISSSLKNIETLKSTISASNGRDESFQSPIDALNHRFENFNHIISSAETIDRHTRSLGTNNIIHGEYSMALKENYNISKSYFKEKAKDLIKTDETVSSNLSRLAKQLEDIGMKTKLSDNDKQTINRIIDKSTKLYEHDIKHHLEAGTLSFKKILLLIIKRYKDILSIKNDFMQASEAVKTFCAENAASLSKSIHIHLKETYLTLDKIELELCLKDKLLTHGSISEFGSLADLIKTFETYADKYSYELLFNNSYPYTNALIENRENILFDLNKDKHPEQFNIIQKRLIDSIINISPQKTSYLKHVENKIHYLHATKMIDERIAELEKEIPNSWFFTKPLKIQKISLLNFLKKGLKDNTYDQMREIIKNHKGYKPYIRSILDGRTSVVFDKTEATYMSRADLAYDIAGAINHLKHRTTVWYSFIFNQTRLKNRIETLEQLQLSVLNPKQSLSESQIAKLKRFDSGVYSRVELWHATQVERSQLLDSYYAEVGRERNEATEAAATSLEPKNNRSTRIKSEARANASKLKTITPATQPSCLFYTASPTPSTESTEPALESYSPSPPGRH